MTITITITDPDTMLALVTAAADTAANAVIYYTLEGDRDNAATWMRKEEAWRSLAEAIEEQLVDAASQCQEINSLDDIQWVA